MTVGVIGHGCKKKEWNEMSMIMALSIIIVKKSSLCGAGINVYNLIFYK